MIERKWYIETLQSEGERLIKEQTIFPITIDFDIHFKRKINDKIVTRPFDDSMSSLSHAKKINMNW